MNVSLELPQETAEKVAQAAADAGKDVPAYLEEFVKRSFTGQDSPRRSVATLLAPFRAEIERSGLTDEQLDPILNEARNRAFTHRRQQR